MNTSVIPIDLWGFQIKTLHDANAFLNALEKGKAYSIPATKKHPAKPYHEFYRDRDGNVYLGDTTDRWLGEVFLSGENVLSRTFDIRGDINRYLSGIR